jgi:glycosyltransferase involved in cell wall biosynthesis
VTANIERVVSAEPVAFERPMRIVVHDYAGHPFQIQLSRELARSGHDVLHLYCDSVPTGRGDLARRHDDAPGLQIEAITLAAQFERYAPSKRLRQEIEYGRALAARVRSYAPTVVVSSNTPLLAQRRIIRACERNGITSVFWQQDMLGLGVQRVLARKNRVLGATIGRAFVALEGDTLRRSSAIVAISDDFLPVLRRWDIEDARVRVIQNWAPLDEIRTAPRDNPWARTHGLVDRTVVLYSGTLGLKHNPELLVELARRHRDRDDVVIVVVSEGLGADHIAEAARRERLTNVRVMPYQPYDELPDVLGSADVLVALLEPDAGVFSVPSKVLSYMCAGRAILAAIPAGNLAARTVRDAGAGFVVEPSDAHRFVEAGGMLVDDGSLREWCGSAARAAAERQFDIRRIADEFETVLRSACTQPPTLVGAT